MHKPKKAELLKSIWAYRPIRYCLFGGISAIIEFSTFALMDKVIPIYAAATISFLFGLASSFIFNKLVVFKNTRGPRVSIREAGLFLALGLCNSQISSIITTALNTIIPTLIAKGLTVIIIALYNYFIMGKIIFKRGEEK